MGLLSPQDWKAQWIGMNNRPVNLYGDELLEDDILNDCKWVWMPGEGNPTQAVPAQTRYFRLSFSVKGDQKISAAVLCLAADNNATGFVNGESLPGSAGFNQPAKFDVATLLKPGRNVIAIAVRNDGDNPNPAGLLGKAVIVYADGSRQILPVDASWKCSDQDVKDWQAEAFDDAGWKNAVAFAANGDNPWGQIKLSGLDPAGTVVSASVF